MMIILTIAVLILAAMAFCTLIVIQLESNKQEDCTIDEIHNEINRLKQENKELKQKRKGIKCMDLDNEELEATRKLHERNNESKLEEAIKTLKIDQRSLYKKGASYKAIETILQVAENSISKDTIKENIKKLKEELSHYNEYTNLNIHETIDVIVLESKINLLEKLIYNN